MATDLYAVEDVTKILRDRGENDQTYNLGVLSDQTDAQTFLFPDIFSQSESETGHSNTQVVSPTNEQGFS